MNTAYEAAAKTSDYKFYIKTNAPAWFLLIANASIEFQTHPRFSVNIPIYYSGLNYFTRTIKFRTLAFQPSIRFWPSGVGKGWFVAPHAGLAWYDIATGGKWRWQDRNGNRPAIGGGIDGGYRLSFGPDRRWGLEFSIGVGIYNAEHDRFHNVRNGLRDSTQKGVYYGLDHFGVSFSYAFDLRKKGGDR